MKLYFTPGTCSLSPHIVLRELALPFELVRVNLSAKKTEAGDDYYAVNPKGYVPALRLDDDSVLTEGVAIVQYLADKKPEAELVPPKGTMERVRLEEWLVFISSEVHKGFSPLFNKQLADDAKQLFRDRLSTRLEYADKQLAGKKFLTGDSFTVADAYLFTVLRWTAFTGIDLTKWANLKAFFDRVGERPSVKAAIEAEGR